MKKQFLAALLLFFSIILQAQKVNWNKLHRLHADKILLSGSRQPTKVLVVGSFHFGYPNLDGHKTDSSKFIDVKSVQRQAEIQELADVIKRFKPTRVYVEAWNPEFHDSLYAEYLAGKYKRGRNEVSQLGYRVAAQMGHKKVYPVDATNFASENYERFPWIDSMWNVKNGTDTIRDQYWSKMYDKLYNAGDSVETTLTMLENFLLMAEPSTLRRMHGHYLASGFNTQANNGPDMLAMWWYSRNLRIVNNILNTKPASDDRIMILIGNGHVPIMKHCFESSPEFELVELKSLLK